MSNVLELLSELNERLDRIEKRLTSPSSTETMRKDWFTVAEVANLLNKRPFTIREWCRLRRIEAKKRPCGRGRTTEWIVCRGEIERYLNDGLLPLDN